VPDTTVELNIFQQWFLLTFALLGTVVLIDSFTLSSTNKIMVSKDLFVEALTSALFVAILELAAPAQA